MTRIERTHTGLTLTYFKRITDHSLYLMTVLSLEQITEYYWKPTGKGKRISVKSGYIFYLV